MGEQNRAWEEHKARERAARAEPACSELADVPLALPALARAAKLGKRAGRVGFDWPDAGGVRAEDRRGTARSRALRRRSRARARKSGICCLRWRTGRAISGVDPEEALRLANTKFERRFRAMEQLAASGRWLSKLDASGLG